MAASVLGFLGNEAVALFRIKVGEAIAARRSSPMGSMRGWGWINKSRGLRECLGRPARIPTSRPRGGPAITAAILWLVWQSGMMVLIRAWDGINPEMITELRHAAAHASGVQAVTAVQARWVVPSPPGRNEYWGRPRAIGSREVCHLYRDSSSTPPSRALTQCGQRACRTAG